MSSNIFGGGQGTQGQQSTQQQSGYDLKLQSLMIYNPKLEPKMRKPTEEDIQDAKLIYYYPLQSAIEEKRNHVGLAEGSYQFWSTFSSSDDSSKCQVTVFDHYFHVQEEVEENIWLYMVWAKNQQSDQEIKAFSDSEEYCSNETGIFYKSRVTPEHSQMLLRHFYSTFQTFYGEFKSYLKISIIKQHQEIKVEKTQEKPVVVEESKQETADQQQLSEDKKNEDSHEDSEKGDKLTIESIPPSQEESEKQVNEGHGDTKVVEGNKQVNGSETKVAEVSEVQISEADEKESRQSFSFLMDQFILRYLDLNGDDTPSKNINVLRYGLEGFQYAPIEKNLFMTLQSLLNMLVNIDQALTDFAIFFNGYFIYSSLEHDIAFTLYEYFYSLDKPFSYSDKKIQNKFSFPQYIQAGEQYFYGSIFNSIRFGIAPADQQTQSPQQQQQIQQQQPQQLGENQSNSEVILQTIFIGKQLQQKQMNVYYEKGLLITMLYNKNVHVQKDKIMEINSAINRNCSKLSTKLEKSIEAQTKKEESYRYLYFNHMNIATKMSNPLTLSALLSQELDTLISIYTKLSAETETPSSSQHLSKTSNIWIYGYKNVGRLLIMLFPGTLSLPKVAEEAEKLFKNYFPLLYL